MAFTADTILELRATGSDSNGGGFDAVSGTPGADFSQQDASEVTYTDLVIDGTTNTNCTSVATPFTSSHVGNMINITSGTGFTVQRVLIKSVAATVATCDKSLGTLSSTGGNGELGGAILSPGIAAVTANFSGMFVWQESGTYTLTSSTINIAGGRPSLLTKVKWEGYGTTRGDRGTKPVISAGAVTSIAVFTSPLNTHATPGYIKNIKVDGNSQSGITGFSEGDRNLGFHLCEAVNCVTGFTVQQIHACLASDCSGTGIIAANATRCVSHDNNIGFASSTSSMEAIDCLAYDNIGAGFSGGQRRYRCIQCTADGNGGDGFIVGSDGGKAISCLSTKNSLFGFDPTSSSMLLDCAGWDNLSGDVDTGALDNDGFITITADPYVNRAGKDFRLNNKTPGGAQARGLGISLPGQIGSRDVGAVQHTDTPPTIIVRPRRTM